MKKSLILLFLIPILGYGQIGESTIAFEKVVEIGSLWIVNAAGTFNGKVKLTKTNDKDYLLSFQDQNFQEISNVVVVKFSATLDELDYLFNELKKTFKSPNEEFKISIGNSILIYDLYRKKEIKITALMESGRTSYFTAGARGLHILFGKEWNKKEWKNYLSN